MFGLKKHLDADETCIDSLRASDFGAKTCLITDKRVMVKNRYYQRIDNKWIKRKGYLNIANQDIQSVAWDKKGNLILHILMLILFWLSTICVFIVLLSAALKMVLFFFFMLFWVEGSADALLETATTAIYTNIGLIIAAIVFRILSHVCDYHNLLCISCSLGEIGIPYTFKSKSRRQTILDQLIKAVEVRKGLQIQ